MQADEFEKKIQDKMEGFELVPDNEVWKQVANRISKEKKERRVVFYWLFAGFVVLAGASGYLFINNENNRKLVINEVNNNVSKGENYKIKQSRPNSSKGLNRVNKAVTKKDIAHFKKGDIKQVLRSRTKKDHKTKDNTPKTPYSKVANNELNGNREKDNYNINKEEKPALRSLPPHRFYNPRAAKAKVDNNKIDKRTNFKKYSSAETIARETIQTKEKINKKWHFGFTVYSGISDNLSGLPLLEKSNALNYSYTSPSPLQNGNSSQSGNYNYNINTLNNFKSAPSFGLGFFLNKPLTNKINLSAGVDYHLYSAKSTVGKRVNFSGTFYDSALQSARSLNEYYDVGYLTTYSNKYHLVQLPINFEFQINKIQEKPLAIFAGISPGYLLSSNALYANPSANVYYVDKEKFRRFQVSAQAGFYFTVKSSYKYLLSAGPVVRYGISNTLKVTGTDQHLFFTGLKANIILK